jgi:unsaturated chondroitin disaccharide hydrolase
MRKFFLSVLGLILIFGGCTKTFDADKYLKYCNIHASKTLMELKGFDQMPRKIEKGNERWDCVAIDDWTSGFWPGILWYLYEYSHDEKLKAQADSFSQKLAPNAYHKAMNHDLGFMMFCSLGNGYRLTENPEYKKLILQSADSLAILFNPKVGTLLSWSEMGKKMGWPHNTIIDNMMNLEILFWAAKNGENKNLYEIAVEHAQTTMLNQFRPDYSNYHVVVYDTISGKKMKGFTHQGYSDSSMWARGQAWAIYGYTMCYRESQKEEFLEFAKKLANVYLKRLPEDYIPFWDFDAPIDNGTPKDASAAAITASALFELSVLLTDKMESEKYFNAAKKMLVALSSGKCLSGNKNNAFLMHSTGHLPNHSEIDASIIYADYYYLEALIRYKKLSQGKSIYDNL